MNFFGGKAAPAARATDETVAALDATLRMIDDASSGDTSLEALKERVTRGVLALKETVVAAAEEVAGAGAGGAGDRERALDALAEVADGLMRFEIMPAILMKMGRVDFETRKNVAAIFCYLVKKDTRGFATAYMARHGALMQQMMSGYKASDLALPCGKMLRECLHYAPLHELMLVGDDGDVSNEFKALLETYVMNPNFEVAADAFETLSAFLKFNKPLVFRTFNPDEPASLARYGTLVELYAALLASENYVLKRQSLKLLSEFLLERENFKIMMRYIADYRNLKSIMQILRSTAANIQFEAFHVFKVFVANPAKPPEITIILATNKKKLIKFLEAFQ